MNWVAFRVEKAVHLTAHTHHIRMSSLSWKVSRYVVKKLITHVYPRISESSELRTHLYTRCCLSSIRACPWGFGRSRCSCVGFSGCPHIVETQLVGRLPVIRPKHRWGPLQKPPSLIALMSRQFTHFAVESIDCLQTQIDRCCEHSRLRRQTNTQLMRVPNGAVSGIFLVLSPGA